MPAGIQVLTEFQLGVESTAGTAVPTTRQYYPDGTGHIDPGAQISFHEGAQRGTYTNITHATKTGEAPVISFNTDPDTGVTLDDLVLPGSMLEGGVTPTGAGPYVWSFTGGSTTHTFDTYTLNVGDDTQMYEVDYGIMSEFSISGGFDDLTQSSAEWMGQAISKVTADAVASNDSASIPSALWTIKYASAQSGLTGASALDVLRSWTLDVDTGLVPRFRADGSLGFKEVLASDNLVGTLQMTWDNNSDAVVQYDNFQSQTVGFFRLAVTQGANSGQIDLAVLWEDVEPVGSESDGVNETLMTGKLVYDATWDAAIAIDVTNDLAALP